MKKINKFIFIPITAMMLSGCKKKKEEEPVVEVEESTIIKNATNTDEYTSKGDYKSIAYAYIFKIKDELASYESETKGTLKAKIAFLDYTITYSSVTHKKGTAFYSYDYSSSIFTKNESEFYMADKDKILVSRDMKNYKVYTSNEYKKVSYTPAQYTIMGYVFNDQSILNTEVVSDESDRLAIKYTLDNVLATEIVKVDMKVNGGLSDYPTYKNIELTLVMKKDFTPISYVIDSVYDASRPVLGTSTVTQHGECIFSKVNQTVEIPNEASLIEKLEKGS